MMKAFYDPIQTCMFMSSSVYLQLCLTKACKMTDQAKWPCSFNTSDHEINVGYIVSRHMSVECIKISGFNKNVSDYFTERQKRGNWKLHAHDSTAVFSGQSLIHALVTHTMK